MTKNKEIVAKTSRPGGGVRTFAHVLLSGTSEIACPFVLLFYNIESEVHRNNGQFRETTVQEVVFYGN